MYLEQIEATPVLYAWLSWLLSASLSTINNSLYPVAVIRSVSLFKVDRTFGHETAAVCIRLRPLRGQLCFCIATV